MQMAKTVLQTINEFRTMVIENPKLPIRFFTSDDCNSGEYSYEESFISSLEIKSLTLHEDQYLDEDDFKEGLFEKLYDEFENEEELNKHIDEIMKSKKFEKSICVYLG